MTRRRPSSASLRRLQPTVRQLRASLHFSPPLHASTSCLPQRLQPLQLLALHPGPFSLSSPRPRTSAMSYAQLAQQYQQEVHAKLPQSALLSRATLDQLPLDVSSMPECSGLLSDEQLAITSLDATELLQEIAAGRLSSVEVVTAFGLRTAIAHQVASRRRARSSLEHALTPPPAGQLPHRLLPGRSASRCSRTRRLLRSAR